MLQSIEPGSSGSGGNLEAPSLTPSAPVPRGRLLRAPAASAGTHTPGAQDTGSNLSTCPPGELGLSRGGGLEVSSSPHLGLLSATGRGVPGAPLLFFEDHTPTAASKEHLTVLVATVPSVSLRLHLTLRVGSDPYHSLILPILQIRNTEAQSSYLTWAWSHSQIPALAG